MEQLNNLDVIFLIIVGISALVGIARGMTKELLSIIGWVLAAAALFYLVPLVNPFMQTYVSSELLASIVSGMLILLIFCIIWILTVDKLASLIRSSKLSALDRLFGFVFGTARGILLVVLVALLISTLMPEDSKKGVFEKSVLFEQANACVEPLKEMIPQSWVDEFKAQSERFGFGKKKKVEEETEDEKKPEEESKDNKENKANEANEAQEKSDAKQPAEKKDDKDAKTDEPKKNGLRETLDNIDNNLDVLQKNGEALFNQLAQPKTEGKNAEQSEAVDELMDDLDKLLDVLDNKMVTSEGEKTDSKKK